MTAAELLSDVFTRVATDPLLLVPAIVLAGFVLEDLATVTVAVLASHMVIDNDVALAAAVAGTVLGDLALYALARWAGERAIVRHWLDGPMLARVLGWVHRRALAMVVVARFTPGFRLPVFAAAGAIGVPALPFAATIMITTLIWTPGLYWTAAQLGGSPMAWTGSLGWVALVVLGSALLAAPRIARAVATGRAQAR